MGNRYQSELNEFHKHFDCFRGKKIVLYGIGRYTATLTDGVHDHCFVGLMDKNPDNVGKIMFGLPILTMEEAEEQADMVIINTSGTYWNIIYQRIKKIKIPVYFLNGKLAEEECLSEVDTTYWNTSLDEIYEKIEVADIVSFDFFDTLFSRSVCNPRDVFAILEEEIRDEMGIDFPYREIRSRAIQKIKENYTLDELYREIGRELGMPQAVLADVYRREINLEKSLLRPRTSMCKVLNYVMQTKKTVYIISDMYLPKSFFREVMIEQQLDIEEDNILISCTEGYSKRQGDLWKKYREEIVKEKSALHIGDDCNADVKMAQKHGIDTYYVASQEEMLRLSSLREIEPQIIDQNISHLMGLISTRIFENPFQLNREKGRVILKDAFEMGYVVFGPVIYCFLVWLDEQVKKDKGSKLVFMSRDGYFLEKDYQFYCEMLNQESEGCYLGISRQLAMTAAIKTEEDMQNFVKMPYSGSVAELLEDRFNIVVKESEKDSSLPDLYQIYKKEIWDHVKLIGENYTNYLKTMNLDDKSAVVDLGYYGNNQRYLNELTGLHMKGYYFNANLSKENANTEKAVMKACFQRTGDKKGVDSKILEKMIFIESFLTAPYGMVKEIDADGAFVCAKSNKNQRRFAVKEKINEGVKQFIRECCENGKMVINEKFMLFTDNWFGLCMSGKVGFTDEIKESFYNDNAMMNRLESALFY